MHDVGPQEDGGGAGDAEPPDAAGAGDAGEDAGPRADAAIDGGTDAGSPDTGTRDAGAPAVPVCQQLCSTPADCAPGGNALQDADNYACDGGVCRYVGCNGTAECDAVYGGGYVCVQHPGAAIPACVLACSVPDDCAVPSPLFDQDNYACTGGGCRWLGCTSAAECQMAFSNPSYVCEMQAGLTFSNCILPCAGAADCAAATSPAYDADNYACTNARCEYLGCNDNAECSASFMTGTWECR